MTGIILAGGKSSRMGKDKCFVKYRENFLIQSTIDAFLPLIETILISANNAKFNDFGYVIVNDEFQDCGPIGGIFSTLKKSPSDINIIAPCDMPFITTDLFRFLLDNLNDYDAVVPIFKGKAEPLTGIYTKKILPIVKNQIETKNFKILNLLNSIKTNFVKIAPSVKCYSENLFTNVNYLEDLDELTLL